MSSLPTVPASDEMDNDTFLRHMDKRHSHEVLDGPLHPHPQHDDVWVGPYRANHDRLHDLASPGEYDHEHLF